LKQIHARQNDTARELWPSPNYLRQVDSLRNAIGEKIFLVEFKPGNINLGVNYTGIDYELLDVINFPRPEPTNGIAPHIIILDDGRGINLGRIARITINNAFNPSDSDTLYRDSLLIDEFLLCERRLSKASIAACSKSLLGEILGKPQSPGFKTRPLTRSTKPIASQ